MINDKKNVNLSKMFEGVSIRTEWDDEKGDYYFSVVDVIKALTNSNNPRH